MHLERNDYRDWLRDILAERVQSNPHYSLRAFARDLAISPASVSLIINRKKGLSRKKAAEVSRRLSLDTQEQELFQALVSLESARDEVDRNIARARIAQITLADQTRQIEMAVFRVMSDWQHFAILQLTSLREFKPDHGWIAGRLHLEIGVVEQSVSRLFRLGLLVSDESGGWKPSERVTFARSDIPSEALRNFHRQVIEKGLRAIRGQRVDERFLVSGFFAIRKQDYPAVVEKVRAAYREISRSSACTPGEGDELYALSMQLFSTTSERDFK